MRARSAAGIALLTAACADAGGPVTIPPAAIDYVDGAVAPVLTHGRTFVIEGFGFGAAQGAGSVTFPAAGGGRTVALIPDAASWTGLSIAAVVPPDAASGTLTLVTAAGHQVRSQVNVVLAVPFAVAALAWQSRAEFPRAPVGVALAPAEFASASGIATTLFAAGGAEPLGGDSVFAPEASVHVARAMPGGAITAWIRQPESGDAAVNRSLPAPRAFAAAAVATPHNARLPDGAILYVVGGIDAQGRAQRTVFGANVTADGVAGPFASLEPLPVPVAGATAALRRGSLYVIGGADADGQPLTTVFVARVAPSGQLDGWYVQPGIPGPRAYGGGALLDRRVVALGGLAASAPPGGGLDETPLRLASGDTAAVSRRSGFFAGPWGAAGALLPEPRSQFATLDVGAALLLVGGVYPGATGDARETLAATYVGDSLGAFAGPVGSATIAGQNGGTLIGPSGATWREGSGVYHGLVLGGMDLATRVRRTGAWGF